jgi:hypothetical protein
LDSNYKYSLKNREMKKLLLVLFVASFVGLAFAFSPARVVSSPEMNGTLLMDDTTKTTKKLQRRRMLQKKWTVVKNPAAKRNAREKRLPQRKKITKNNINKKIRFHFKRIFFTRKLLLSQW